MDEKQLLIADRYGRAPRERHTWVKWVLIFALVNLGLHQVHRRAHIHPGQQEIQYAGEHIKWFPCGETEGHELECSTIDVPLDQFNVTRSDKTFSIPLIRLRGRNATQNLFLNPGGPGGSGLSFMHRRGAWLHEIVGEDFHLLSFDPRSINASRPQGSCYPDAASRQHLSPVRSKNLLEDSGELWAWSKNLVQACEDTMGEYGPYINTPQTAADMNSILDAIGQEDMVYWGFSYGSLLGQTYATMFPDRSKRVIIDGVLSQFQWFVGLDLLDRAMYQNLMLEEDFADTDNAFQGFLDECFKAKEDCALASLADTKEELAANLTSFIDNLRDEPLSVYINSTSYGLLDYQMVWMNGVLSALYKPSTWYGLADQLAAMLQGNGTEAFLAFHEEPSTNNSTEAGMFVMNNDGLCGSENWPADRQSTVDKLLAFANTSRFAESQLDGYFVKQAWKIPKTHDFVPGRGVQTAHPLLILSTTYDPICPLVSARAVADAFEGSRLVELLGYGHCSIAMPSICIARHVRAFLSNGTLPEKGATCEVDSPYFIKPEEDGALVSTTRFANSDEQRIHLAQVELSQAEWFNEFPWK